MGGVLVHARFARRHNSGYGYHCGDYEATTDATGSFLFRVPTVFPRNAEWAVVEFDAPDWVQPETLMVRSYGTTLLRRQGSDEVLVSWLDRAAEVPADARALGLGVSGDKWPRVRVVLERGAPIAGVVETEAHVPVAGAEVHGLWRDGERGLRVVTATTDDRGGFSMIVPVPVFVRARAADEGRTREASAGPVAPGASGLRLVLSPLSPVDVHVHGPEGRVYGWVRVRLTRVDPRGLEEPTSDAVLDEERSAVGWCTPGTYDVEIAPLDAPLLPARARAVIPGPPVDVHCSAAARIEGELEGEDLEGFEITWTGTCNPAYRRRDWSAGFDTYSQHGATARVGKESKTFLLEAVGETEGDVYARREGDARCAFVAAHRASHGQLRLVLAPGAKIAGAVEAPDGLDLTRLHVQASRGALSQRAAVREDGGFVLVGLPQGIFRVELLSAGFPWGLWLHDACDRAPAGAGDYILLRVRLPATEPEDDGS